MVRERLLLFFIFQKFVVRNCLTAKMTVDNVLSSNHNFLSRANANVEEDNTVKEVIKIRKTEGEEKWREQDKLY